MLLLVEILSLSLSLGFLDESRLTENLFHSRARAREREGDWQLTTGTIFISSCPVKCSPREKNSLS